MLRERFEAWQRHGEMHPFTCGGGGGPCSGLSLEFAREDDTTLVMRCPSCGREQIELKVGTLCRLIENYPLEGFRPEWIKAGVFREET